MKLTILPAPLGLNYIVEIDYSLSTQMYIFIMKIQIHIVLNSFFKLHGLNLFNFKLTVYFLVFNLKNIMHSSFKTLYIKIKIVFKNKIYYS